MATVKWRSSNSVGGWVDGECTIVLGVSYGMERALRVLHLRQFKDNLHCIGSFLQQWCDVRW